jgi:hypothetical protein
VLISVAVRSVPAKDVAAKDVAAKDVAVKNKKKCSFVFGVIEVCSIFLFRRCCLLQ